MVWPTAFSLADINYRHAQPLCTLHLVHFGVFSDVRYFLCQGHYSFSSFTFIKALTKVSMCCCSSGVSSYTKLRISATVALLVVGSSKNWDTGTLYACASFSNVSVLALTSERSSLLMAPWEMPISLASNVCVAPDFNFFSKNTLTFSMVIPP